MVKTEISDKHLQSLENFVGYGNPDKAQVFFMGIEEHHVIEDFRFEPWGKYTVRSNPPDSIARGVTEKMQCQIFRRLVADMQDGPIFQSGIHSFNYYPVGARNLSTLPTALRRFKNKGRLYEYIEQETDRLGFLRMFIQDKILRPRKLFFVLGKELRERAQRLMPAVEFCEPYAPWNKGGAKPSPIQWSNDKSIWLTGHPSHGWITNEVVERIAEIRGHSSPI